jgi:hypothetical protein
MLWAEETTDLVMEPWKAGNETEKTDSAQECLTKAIFHCCKALYTDKTSMKAHYRRGQVRLLCPLTD